MIGCPKQQRGRVVVGLVLAAALVLPILVSSFAGADAFACLAVFTSGEPVRTTCSNAGVAGHVIGAQLCGTGAGTAPAATGVSGNPLTGMTITVAGPVWVSASGNVGSQTGYAAAGVGDIVHAGVADDVGSSCP